MAPSTLLPIMDGLRIESLATTTDSIVVRVTTDGPYACCPLCGQSSARIHSHYQRTLADLPWNRVAVRIQVRARKFFCDNPVCERTIFTEALPQLADRYARKTKRLRAALYLIGYALGGEAGARVALGLGLSVSPDTLLRRVRQVTASAAAEQATVPVLGVDDWAFRKGRRYGTVLVDLQCHRLVDLLPDREAQTLASWLQVHPEIEVISRDRAGAYAQGALQGAPHAQQVADRWHLVKNLAEALERLLEQHRALVRQAAALLEETPPVVWPPSKGKATEADRKQRRCHRRQRYQQVVALHLQGVSKRQIAKQLGLARMTVLRYLNAGEFPEIAKHKPRPTSLDPFKPYLHQRWQEGCRNACQLARELKVQGYQGTASWVCRYVTGLRQAAAGVPTPRMPATRTVACLFVRSPDDLQHKERAFLAHLCRSSPALQSAYALAQQFVQMVRQRQKESLSAWMDAVSQSGLAVLSRFCDSLQQDLCAVEAGLSLCWSNGQTEGQVNRLKLIKRQMYGRAKFDLLRARVLPMVEAA